MKEFTKEEALAEIFGRKKLNGNYRMWKCRFGKGTLSNAVVDNILQENNYVISQPSLYKKKK